MKKEFLMAFTALNLLFVPPIQANAASDLQPIMQSMSAHFKTIVLSSKDVTKYPALADEALGLQDDVLLALATLPEKVSLIPDVSVKRAAKVEFRSLLTQVLQNSIALEEVLLRSNPSAADVQVVGDKIAVISQLMKDGHKKFK